MWIEISPSELIILRDNHGLVAGTSYAFEFQTKHIITGTETLNIGVSETLVITAATDCEFFKEARSLNYPSDTIEFDFNDNLCEDQTTIRYGKILKRRNKKM